MTGRGRIVGVDVSSPMLEVAREIEPAIDWREGDAATLPVGTDEQFDRAICQQGFQFFADRAAAAAELRRVLVPGGLMIAAVWRAAQEMPALYELQQVAERHVGMIKDQRYAFGDVGALEQLFQNAGFRDVRTETLSLRLRFPDGAEFVRMNAMALVGMSGVRLSEQEQQRVLDAIVRESAQAARPFFDGAALVCEMRSNVATARTSAG
jgi:SAM-dependent methyltransferase